MTPLEEAIEATLRKLGLGEPTVMMDLSRNWDEFAGEPWTGVTRPLYLLHETLVIEVLSPPAMGFLRYGLGEMERRLAEKYGKDTIAGVELRVVPRRPGRVP